MQIATASIREFHRAVGLVGSRIMRQAVIIDRVEGFVGRHRAFKIWPRNDKSSTVTIIFAGLPFKRRVEIYLNGTDPAVQVDFIQEALRLPVPIQLPVALHAAPTPAPFRATSPVESFNQIVEDRSAEL